MEQQQEPVAQDRNLLGRLGAVVVIVAVVAGLGRVLGCGTGVCPFMGGAHMCPFLSHESAAPASPAAPAETPAAPAAPAAPVEKAPAPVKK